jgi:hypothetical protein
VDFTGEGGQSRSGHMRRYTSTGVAFEFDDVASNVPEPAT